MDTNREMVATACERGLDAVHADALVFLDTLPDGSLGGLMAAQVVEHLAPPYLSRLLAAAFQKLRAGAPIVVETINPACWLAFFSSYIRDFTHAQPVHPETLQYLLQANGFGNVTLQYSQPVPEHMKMQPVDVAGHCGGRRGPRGGGGPDGAHGQRERGDSQQPAVHASRLRRHRLSELMERIDVAVIGAGVTGLASALALAARGRRCASSSGTRAPGWIPARTTAASSTRGIYYPAGHAQVAALRRRPPAALRVLPDRTACRTHDAAS